MRAPTALVLFSLASCRGEAPPPPRPPAPVAPPVAPAPPPPPEPAVVGVPPGWWPAPSDADEPDPSASVSAHVDFWLPRLPVCAADSRRCWDEVPRRIATLAGAALHVPGTGVDAKALAWVEQTLLPVVLERTRAPEGRRHLARHAALLRQAQLARDVVEGDAARLTALLGRWKADPALDLRPELSSWGVSPGDLRASLATGDRFRWLVGFWVRRHADGTAGALARVLAGLHTRLPPIVDEPENRSQFNELAASLAAAQGLRVVQRFAGQLDEDPALEFAAALCPPEGAPRVLAHDAKHGTWEVTQPGPQIAGVEPCAAPPPEGWTLLEGALDVGEESGYPAGAFRSWAFRGSALVVVRTHQYAGGMSGLDETLDFDTRRFSYTSLSGDGAGAVLVAGPTRPVEPFVLAGAEAHAGPADATLSVGVARVGDAWAFAVTVKDDVTQPPAADATLAALVEADHLQVWTDAGAVAIGCAAPGQPVVHALAGPRGPEQPALPDAGTLAKLDVDAFACPAAGWSFTLKKAPRPAVTLVYADVDGEGKRSLLATSRLSLFSARDTQQLGRVVASEWPAVGRPWPVRRAP